MPTQLSRQQRAPIFGMRRSTRLGLKLMLESGPREAWALLFLSVALGLLPTAFTIATGALVGIAQRGDVGVHFAVALAVVAITSIALEAGSNLHAAVGEGFRQRVDGRRRERVIIAALTPPGVAHLENPEVVDMLHTGSSTDQSNPGTFAVGMYGMLIVRVIGLASAVVVASFRWWLGLSLVVMWLWAGRVLRLGCHEAWEDTDRDLRRADYLRDLAFQAPAAKEVRIFGFASWLVESYSGAWNRIMREVWRRSKANRLRQVSVLTFVVVAHGIAFWIIVAATRAGDISVARLAVVVPAMLAMSSIGEVTKHTGAVTFGAIALTAIAEAEERLVTGPEFKVPGERPATGLPAREIRFEKVAFTYPHRTTPVYKSLDLRIAAGTSLAIVGSNGAGKTTLVKLLARLLEPTAGRILVDGVDLRELDARKWQRRVAAIFQDFVHYDLSAEDNVGFGALHIAHDRDALARAASRVGALDLIERLPARWDTVLTRRYEGGMDLSGGQWQRLALARALFALEGGAGVLVLDEPTASLDVRAEAEVFDRFLDVTAGATTVLISHRFSTVRRADRIVVLEHGEVVEDGSHDQLLAAGGRYARSFLLQAQRYEDGNA
jgi:ABC-type multidrug transport system fused ATPase/permease subunit